MKNRFLTRILSLTLSLLVLVSTIPLTAIVAFAGGSSAEEENKNELPRIEAVEREMADRAPITKDRSEIKASSVAAVYVDDKLVYEGGFSPAWNTAMEYAPNISEESTPAEIKEMSTVEFVLNRDIHYDYTWFGEETMTVSGKKFTIDLNGHLLNRTDADGSVIIVTEYSVLTIMDSNPYTKNTGTIENFFWRPSSDGKDVIMGGVITGGYYKSGNGGGLYVEEQSTVYMTGGTIAGNKADVGAAVYLDDGSILDMSRGNAQICYNYCAGTSTDGGAVFLCSDSMMIGGYVHHNLADDYGGGVRAKGDNILIMDVTIYANKAEEFGGGLYLERSGTGQVVTVTGCKIVGNYSGDCGGGVYVYDLYMAAMSDCTVEHNAAKIRGGGICIGDAIGSDLQISGKMTVRDNHISSQGKMASAIERSNLYIEGDDDLIVGTLTLDSEIWVRVGSDASDYNGVESPITAAQTDTSHLFFFSDDEDYSVHYQYDPHLENYRHLYLKSGARTDSSLKTLVDYETKKLQTPYKIETGNYAGTELPLYRGYYEYYLMTSKEFYSASPFYYSDGYFFEDPKTYNYHLATMSISMAVAAFGRPTEDVKGNAYANHFSNIKQLFAEIGCSDNDFFVNESFQIKPTFYGNEEQLSTIGVAISQKEISANGDTYILLPVAIRGGNYEAEWGSNLTIGAEGEAGGFADSADQVFGHVQDYIEDYGLSEELAAGKIKFWVVGYSRGGATANLTSKRLVDAYVESGNQVFGYTFESPQGGLPLTDEEKNDANDNGAYLTIHNILNENDFVTLVAPSEMGFIRYGVEHKIGADFENGDGISYEADSKYYQQRMKMVKQLYAINPYYNFDDGWEIADINIFLGAIGITDFIDKGEQIWDDPNPECLNIYDFLRWFFQRIQADGLVLPLDSENNEDFSGSRYGFAVDKPLANIEGNRKNELSYAEAGSSYNFAYSEMTVEEAFRSLLVLMFSMSDETQADLINIAMANALGIGTGLLDHLNRGPSWSNVSGFNGYMAFFASKISGLHSMITEAYDLYTGLLDDWDTNTDLENAQSINYVLSKLITPELLALFDEETQEVILESLPVALWFALNFASRDYNEDVDDGMWAIGTFLNNMTVILTNHHQEVSVAWVRSYDDYYENDTQAFVIDLDQVSYRTPYGKYKVSEKEMTLNAEPGASIFYSTDLGETWELYTKPVTFEQKPEEIWYFSIYRCAKSEVRTLSTNTFPASLIGEGNLVALTACVAIALLTAGIGIVVIRRKRRTA